MERRTARYNMAVKVKDWVLTVLLIRLLISSKREYLITSVGFISHWRLIEVKMVNSHTLENRSLLGTDSTVHAV
jgi:hypothetical protein